MITIRLPLLITSDGQFKREQVNFEDFDQVSRALLNDFNLNSNNFYLSKCSESVYQVRLRLPGGKGGFGSQLRAQGNKMSSKKRAGNYESCRSLNGQRLRVQKQTKMIEEYLAKEPERLSKKEQEIRDKMQKHLDAPDKKVMFSDPEYFKLCRKLIDGTEDAVRSRIRSSQVSLNEEIEDNYVENEDEDQNEDEKAPLRKNDRITSKYLEKYLKK